VASLHTARGGLIGLAASLLCLACSRESPKQAPAAAASVPASAVPKPSARRPKQAPLADERIDVVAGTFLAGSIPGQAGRVPELEPRRYEVQLGPFQIDRLPFPNDPNRRPVTSVSREEALRLCAERGARLCTELEWERACKGPASDHFSSGESWDPRCSEEPRACASGFDVLAMGGALREWTASDVIPTDTDLPRRAAVRGAAASEPTHAHRCAARRGIDPATRADDLGFRCCKGAPNAAVVREPKLGQTFQKSRLKAERLEQLLAADPQTASLAEEVLFFREPDAAKTVIARGPGDKKGFAFTVSPLLWQPVAGAEYLLVAGRSGEDTSFVLAYYVLGKDKYRLASSFIMQREAGPVAFAFSGYIRPRLHFSTCWGCPGETGKILFRKPDSVVILQP
jgi:hypothetical protein